MKKSFIIALIAVFPLMFSCGKEISVEAPEAETPEIQADPWTAVPMPEIPCSGGPATLVAGFVQTKSQLEMNGAGTHAKVVWSAGDDFVMRGFWSSGSDISAKSTYTTESGGDLAEFRTESAPSAGATAYYSIHPAAAHGNHCSVYADSPIFEITIPDNQTATPDGVDETANISAAISEHSADNLHFTNLVSLIKFKLSGANVGSVASIAFIGTSNLAGDWIITPDGGGSFDYLPNLSFGGSSRSRSVTLTGPFVAGTDYYIAVTPSVQDGFSMIFTHTDGEKKIKKMSSKTLTLNRSQIYDFGTIALGDEFPDVEPALTPYIAATTSSPLKPVTIVVIPDGFTSEQLDDYELKAKAGINAMFATEPYKTYKNYFNVWILKVASNESGARISDGTPEEQNRDCYFQSTWGSDSYDSMSANENRVFSFVEDNCPDILDGTHTIEEVPVLIIINDNRYGGISWNWSSGTTYCMVPTSFDGSTVSWGYPDTEAASIDAVPWDTHAVTSEEITAMGLSSGTWKNTLVHEFGGHSFGKLGDEYWYSRSLTSASPVSGHSWTPVPFDLNLSNDKEVVGWDKLINDSDVTDALEAKSPLYAQRIGVFQGGDVSMFYRWRSEKISCMIDNRFYFSTWQRYLIVQRILTLANHDVNTTYTPYNLPYSTFIANDHPEDPLRDGGGGSGAPALGVSTKVPPRPMPMLPPPVLVNSPLVINRGE
jgi:hypothetical protein